MTMIDFKIEVGISDQRVKDLICSGFEGGVGYWCQIMDFNNPHNEPVDFNHIDIPFVKDGAIICQAFVEADSQDEDDYWLDEDGIRLPLLKLDKAACQRGLSIMQAKYPRHFSDFLAENDDADTGDVFIQCALLGEIIYG